MPSEIHKGPSGDFRLDSRYGDTRIGFDEAGAVEMARLDNLVEKAGVNPGDKVELLAQCTLSGDYVVWPEPKWVKVDGTFLAIDNCRVRLKVEGKGNGVHGYSVWSVMDIRKAD